MSQEKKRKEKKRKEENKMEFIYKSSPVMLKPIMIPRYFSIII
jgi:hypothetical protein